MICGVLKMSRIVVIQYIPTKIEQIYDKVFYLEELAQCLKYEHHFNMIYIYNLNNFPRKKLLERYKRIIPTTKTIKKNDILICDIYHLLLLLQQNIKCVESCQYIILLDSIYTNQIIENIYKQHYEYICDNEEKFYILTERKFETETIRHKLFQNKILYYNRGFYFNEYINENINILRDDWFISSRDFDEEQITELTIKKLFWFIKKYKYKTTNDIITYHPANLYQGLFYLKSKNYTSRLPFEFWYYKKPVIFFDRSTSLLKFFKYEDLPLYLPLYKQESPQTNILRLTNFLRTNGINDRRKN